MAAVTAAAAAGIGIAASSERRTFWVTTVRGFESQCRDEIAEQIPRVAPSDCTVVPGGVVFAADCSIAFLLQTLRSVDKVCAYLWAGRHEQLCKLPDADAREWLALRTAGPSGTAAPTATATATAAPDTPEAPVSLERWIAALALVYEKVGHSRDTAIRMATAAATASPTATATATGSATGSAAASGGVVFRVSATRDSAVGHAFTSERAAGTIGAAIIARFGWGVNLKHHSVDVAVSIVETNAACGLVLASDIGANRFRAPPLSAWNGKLWRTALQPHAAYLIARYAWTEVPTLIARQRNATATSGAAAAADTAADAKSNGVWSYPPYPVVVDPMCGIGSLPIESAARWPNARYFGGDLDRLPVEQANSNALFAAKSVGAGGGDDKNPLDAACSAAVRSIEFVEWDATALPFAAGGVDLIMSDIPFGKRHGSQKQNEKLYPQILREFARVSRPGAGVALVLTLERRMMDRLLATTNAGRECWRLLVSHRVVIGFELYLFVLLRTEKAVPPISIFKLAQKQAAAKPAAAADNDTKGVEPASGGANPISTPPQRRRPPKQKKPSAAAPAPSPSAVAASAAAGGDSKSPNAVGGGSGDGRPQHKKHKANSLARRENKKKYQLAAASTAAAGAAPGAVPSTAATATSAAAAQ